MQSIYLKEMKDKAYIIDAFSEMAPKYELVVDSELNRFWGWSYNGFVNLLLASTPVQQQDIILDVATGTGVIPYRLEKDGHPRNQIHPRCQPRSINRRLMSASLPPTIHQRADQSPGSVIGF